jgi:hypothetical protein
MHRGRHAQHLARPGTDRYEGHRPLRLTVLLLGGRCSREGAEQREHGAQAGSRVHLSRAITRTHRMTRSR